MAGEFDRRVYEALARVPRGMVTTYKLLARRVGCNSCRAVGQALRRNRHAPAVPCHRVIASDLSPGGYMGRSSGRPLARKLALLAAEGVRFERGRLADESKLYRF